MKDKKNKDIDFEEIDATTTSSQANQEDTETLEEASDNVRISETTGDKPYNASRQRLLVLLPIAIILILIIIVVIRVIIWNQGSTYHYEATGDFDVTLSESQDYIVAMDRSLVEGRDDDDTYILFLGDDILTYGDKSIASIVEDNTGATVYNCGFSGSSYARDADTLSLDTCDDVFSFHSLATCILSNDFTMIDYYKTYADIYEPETYDPAIETLKSVDFNDVDIIFLCYGTNDYLRVHKTSDVANPVASDAVTGSLTIGMNAIHEKYPHIRFVIVSPTFCFYTEEDGSLTPGDQRFVGTPLAEQDIYSEHWGDSYETISGYVTSIQASAYENLVTYLDMYYDNVLHAENADKYLDDAIHVNQDVRNFMGEKLTNYVKYQVIFQ